MINKELLDFIKDQTQKGAGKEVVSKELLGAGWTVADIEEAFGAVSTATSVPKTEVPIQPVAPNINPAPKIDLSAPQSINQFGFEQKTTPEIKKEPQPQTSFQPIVQPEIKHETIEPEIKKPEPIQPIQPIQPVQPIQPKIEPKIIEPIAKPQPIMQSQTPVSNFGSFNSYASQMSPQATIIKEKSGSALKTFLIVLIIFLLAGSALGYFFKDKIINYFAVKDTAQPETPLVPENPAPVASEINNNIGNPFLSCKGLADGSDEKSACYFSKAGEISNISQCELINEEEAYDKDGNSLRDFCYNMLSIYSKNIEDCTFIKNSSARGECFNYLKKTNGSDCNSIKSEVDRSECIKLTLSVDNSLSSKDKTITQCNDKNNLPSSEEESFASLEKDWGCFFENLKKCEPAVVFSKYSIRTSLPDQILSYEIIGKKNEKCEVDGPVLNALNAKIYNTSCKLDSIIMGKFQKEKNNSPSSYRLIQRIVSDVSSAEHKKYCAS